MNTHKKQQIVFKDILSKGKLSHAYIFYGTEGIGKKIFAKELAKSLLCEKGIFFEDCGCPSCTLIKNGTHPDLYIFESKQDPKDENQLNIKAVRRIAGISETTAYKGGWKVIILDDIHLLSVEGTNALLKTLEEPGENTVFFLITHSLNKVLPTIRSRAAAVEFNPLSDCELLDILETISPDGAWHDIAPYAAGSVRTAIMLNEFKIKDFITAIANKDKNAIGFILFSANSKDKLRAVCGVLLLHFIDKYKKGTDPDVMKFIQNLKIFINNLEYNVNLNIQLLYLYTMIMGALQI